MKSSGMGFLAIWPLPEQLQPELTVTLLTRDTSFNQVPRRSRSGGLLTEHSRDPPLLLLENAPLLLSLHVNSLPETYLDPQSTISYTYPVFSKDCFEYYHYPSTGAGPLPVCEILSLLCTLRHQQHTKCCQAQYKYPTYITVCITIDILSIIAKL